MVLLTLYDADANASHDQKYHVASPSDCPELTNGMVPLMTLLTSCNTETSINDITWPKKLCCTLFRFSWLNEHSGAIYILTIPLTSHDADASARQQMTEKVKLHLILSILNLQMQWCYLWCHQYHVMPTQAWHDQKIHVAPYFLNLDLTNKILPLTAWQQCWY